MWGHVLTEASTQQNFNFGFSTYKSEILVHLSQWQYWWWFWFSIWWTLYYFIILRVITKRTFNFHAIMNTSVRGRGKWGDFLVALIPISWCCNILINSNFILRMIEWQNESSLFTIRIQGKQWYWVYKYDPNTANAVISTPKNIGHNRWRVLSHQDSYNADTYYQAIHLAAHLEFQESYSKFTKKIDTHKKSLSKLTLSNDKIYIPVAWEHTSIHQTPLKYSEDLLQMLESEIRNEPISVGDFTSQDLTTPVFADCENVLDVTAGEHTSIHQTPLKYSEDLLQMLESEIRNEPISVGDFTSQDLTSSILVESENVFEFTSPFKKKNYVNFLSYGNLSLHSVYYSTDYYNYQTFTDLFNQETHQFNAYYDFLQLDETSDTDSNTRHYLTTQPFRLMRGVLNQHVSDILQSETFKEKPLNKLLFLNTKFSQTGESVKDKELMPETLWGFRQKKYKRLKKFKFKPQVIYDPTTFAVIGHKDDPVSPSIDIAGLELQKLHTTSNTVETPDVDHKSRSRPVEEPFNYRISTRINRHRSELVPVTLARRLLRTKRTLVLPAHVNLTLITNSYDVVHSWFIPGLGLKLDCVPGRSTHHTLYIDNIGFYYGQCAEICGRYHHHMPIRVCALPFEHFVVWWQSKGAARMNRTSEISKNKFIDYTFNNPVTRDKLLYRMN